MEIATRPIHTWKSLVAKFHRHARRQGANWIFRGQSDASDPLSTSLERDQKTYHLRSADMLEIEGGLIRKFKRQYNNYSADPPQDLNYPEWLALMRHHGAPTRLLDWTYSFFAAVFFALEQGKSSPAAVFALSSSALQTALKRKHPDIYKPYEQSGNLEDFNWYADVFTRYPPVPFVSTLNAYRQNERVAIQQGVFLCPGDVTRSFEDNLGAILGHKPEASVIVKYVIPQNWKLRGRILRRIYRMNMNHAVLFPGLDGFARSLHQYLVFPKRYIPPDREYVRTLRENLARKPRGAARARRR